MARTPLPPPKVNRLDLYISQIQDYWFRGPYTRFARDAGISPSTLSRLIHNRTRPHYDDVCKIAALLERKLGRKIDPRDILEY